MISKNLIILALIFFIYIIPFNEAALTSCGSKNGERCPEGYCCSNGQCKSLMDYTKLNTKSASENVVLILDTSSVNMGEDEQINKLNQLINEVLNLFSDSMEIPYTTFADSATKVKSMSVDDDIFFSLSYSTGSNFSAGLQRAQEFLNKYGKKKNGKKDNVVIFSAGNPQPTDSDGNFGTAIINAINSANALKNQGVTIYTINVNRFASIEDEVVSFNDVIEENDYTSVFELLSSDYKNVKVSSNGKGYAKVDSYTKATSGYFRVPTSDNWTNLYNDIVTKVLKGSTSSSCYYSNGCEVDFGSCYGVPTTTTKSEAKETTTVTSTKINPTYTISPDGRCGEGIGICKSDECCSKFGWCGKSNRHCMIEQGCQQEFGNCKSTNGKGETTMTKLITTTTTSTTKPTTTTTTTKGPIPTSVDGQCGSKNGAKCPSNECCNKGICYSRTTKDKKRALTPINNQKISKANIVLVLDNSASMKGWGITKLNEALRSFVKQLPDGIEIAYTLFAESATDIQIMSNKIAPNIKVDMNSNGTTFGAGLIEAQSYLLQLNNGKENVIILFSDGAPEHDAYEYDDGEARANAINTATKVKDSGITIFTINVNKMADSEAIPAAVGDRIGDVYGMGQWFGVNEDYMNTVMQLISSNFKNAHATGQNNGCTYIDSYTQVASKYYRTTTSDDWSPLFIDIVDEYIIGNPSSSTGNKEEIIEKCYVSNGCESEFGFCYETSNPTPSEPRRCGPGVGYCRVYECCNKDGYCGFSDSDCYINQGCQNDYGYCKISIEDAFNITEEEANNFVREEEVETKKNKKTKTKKTKKSKTKKNKTKKNKDKN
ncbi:hypothetical protein BCR32DRAFT_285072 [Anaeromyces robustus]|uniref:VWA-like protein n=1 Tax=Anaeromyces robustus TaxID=1754192 RepID=A0A1Y1WPV1_9FUNG|nr:hypothetical protein BCR32DRAFT_285072 [Anaeromyces robustus]|eukprot:ORX75553.1 hypothetical protein BCR32DRAFT_285072 [Anaeromyces robustus]